jgi:hypothetical protein
VQRLWAPWRIEYLEKFKEKRKKDVLFAMLSPLLIRKNTMFWKRVFIILF